MKIITFTILFMMILSSSLLLSQETDHIDKHIHHEHHNNEIGVAIAPVYFVKEKEFSYGLHMHYVHTIRNSKFGIGLGYEKIFDEHEHNTFGIVAVYRPINELSFNISPGLTFEKNKKNANFALHIETSYEFEVHNFHIGPVLEFAYDPEDIHISLGIHIGFGF